MRYMVFAAVVSLVVAGMVGIAPAAGLQKVGEEECRCSPLVANGVIPDVWNQLALLLTLPNISQAVDNIAVDFKEIVGQFGINGGDAVAGAIVPRDRGEAKPAAAKPKDRKKTAKTTKPRKLRAPRRTPTANK